MSTNQTPGSGRRKRTRPHDEPDSSPAVTPNITAAVKRRRLNTLVKSSPSTPKGVSAIKSAIGGALKSGRRGSAKKNTTKSTSDDSYEVPESLDRNEATEKLLSLPVKHKKLGLRPPIRSRRPSTNVYEVPDSGDEADTAQAGVSESNDDVQRTPSRRKKASAISTTSSKKSVSTRLLESRKKKPVAQVEDEIVQQDTPKRKGRPLKAQNSPDVPSPTTTPLKSQPAKRNVDALSPVKLPAIKGILTPQKKRVGRPRKSVAFHDGDSGKENEVFFENIQSKTAKAKPQGKTKTTTTDEEPVTEGDENEAQDSEDDEVCAICSKPDSEPPNEIIFCENCDMAVHQKCYNVPIIPEGDWICRNCSQDDVLPGPKATPKKQIRVTKTTDMPTIPNFEQHLRHMQRVLLDRCSGSRRLKLCGQTEAYDKAFQLVEQTVLSGESNSMMVIGARGCGKTTLMEEIISNLRTDHQEEFHVVRLNGFIHTDDKLALKDIWRQLGKEMNLEDDLVNKVRMTTYVNLEQSLTLTRRATTPIRWLRYWLFYLTPQKSREPRMV